ncbi:hypothetical protein [Streptomyces decoyicus]|uniref:hypothetical protein n=1 Tax=Streptomyces decoyicus TaxID=249567 RepID=UPI00386C2654
MLDQRIVPSYAYAPLIRDGAWNERSIILTRSRCGFAGVSTTLEEAVMDPEGHSLIDAQITDAKTGELEYDGE